MTDAARLVLADAKHVRERLENETDGREWRLAWALAVVLLRTVGDVLDKVDGVADRRVKSASAELYRSWKVGKENAIFRDFIKVERDCIVHEYLTSMTEGQIPVAVIGPDEEESPIWLDDEMYRPLGAGRYVGEDGRDVIDEAISWWERQLEEIENRALK